MSLLQTRYWVVACDGCDAYVIPDPHQHPNPRGRKRNGVMLADPPAARDAAKAAGWATSVRVGREDGSTDDLCPACAAAAEKKKEGER
jgi:hypothetical protein